MNKKGSPVLVELTLLQISEPILSSYFVALNTTKGARGALAHPYQSGIVGENRMELADENSYEIHKRCMELAARGGGHLSFTFVNPSENYREELKIVAIRPVDETWACGLRHLYSGDECLTEPDDQSTLWLAG